VDRAATRSHRFPSFWWYRPNGGSGNGWLMPERRAPNAAPANAILGLAVREAEATLVLRLDGEFDLAGVGSVENVLDRMSQPPPLARVVFDLRDLSFLDLAGLQTILRADARGRAGGCQVLVARPRGTANRVFTLTRAGETLRMVDRPPD
jgi:anti-anti-sigma factor